MKYKNKIATLTIVVLTTITIISCSKKDFAINKNPDSPTDASASYSEILPAALQSTSYIMANTNTGFLQNYMGFWARSGDFQPSVDEETYAFTTSFGPSVGLWNTLYSNATNYNITQQKAKAAGAGTYEAISRIMKAQSFQYLVDVFGNIPYSQALKGASVPTPVYDNGVDIYKSLLRELDSAILTLKSPSTNIDKNPNIATIDFVYGGNTTKWIRFANTLKLRLLVHAFRVNGIDKAAEMAIINTEGTGFIMQDGPSPSSVAADRNSASIDPGFVDTKPTPFSRNFVQNEAGSQTGNSVRANDFAIRYYAFNGDPRANRFYLPPTVGGALKGIRYGLTPAPSANLGGGNLSKVTGPGLLPKGAASRAWILTSVESLFLQAEARERNIITTGATARDRLRDAIRESFVWLGLTAAQADAYVTSNATYPDVDYNGVSQGAGLPAGGIFTILSQKWFALNSINILELWTDYRRTDFLLGSGGGFDAGPPISVFSANTATKIPVRLLYPQNEYNVNATNVGGQGVIDRFTSRIFWDL